MPTGYDCPDLGWRKSEMVSFCTTLPIMHHICRGVEAVELSNKIMERSSCWLQISRVYDERGTGWRSNVIRREALVISGGEKRKE